LLAKGRWSPSRLRARGKTPVWRLRRNGRW